MWTINCIFKSTGSAGVIIRLTNFQKLFVAKLCTTNYILCSKNAVQYHVYCTALTQRVKLHRVQVKCVCFLWFLKNIKRLVNFENFEISFIRGTNSFGCRVLDHWTHDYHSLRNAKANCFSFMIQIIYKWVSTMCIPYKWVEILLIISLKSSSWVAKHIL